MAKKKKEQVDEDGITSKAELLENEDHPCPICARPLGLISVDRHHLIPKSRKGKVQYYVHKICHRKLHATFTEKELENNYSTWAEILENEVMQKFIKWVAKKDPAYYSGTDETKDRRK